ncbi:MAG: 50S ribosomal protein L2 [Nanoarchaeota archaeon]|nr:50S ribosomal protein L2 [Nanoarchaeota archaeon]
MGKNLIQQRRGKGSPTFRALSKKYLGRICHIKNTTDDVEGRIIDIVKCPGHYGPVAMVKYDNNEEVLMIAPEGVRVGDSVAAGKNTGMKPGNTAELKEIPEGTLIYNIESMPGDGGKFCRTSGTFGRVSAKFNDRILVLLPSKKERAFIPTCRANIGVIAGSGRKEKPFYKAGKKYYARKARNKYYPSVSATSMNAVDHPFGGSSSARHKMPLQSSKHDPPGRKAGNLSPRGGKRKKR